MLSNLFMKLVVKLMHDTMQLPETGASRPCFIGKVG
jgi:hypothetical protein